MIPLSTMNLGTPGSPFNDVHVVNLSATTYLQGSTITGTTNITSPIIQSNDFEGPISVNSNSTNANTNINFVTLSGSLSATGDITVNLPTVVTSANILNINSLLGVVSSPTSYLWYPPENSASSNNFYYETYFAGNSSSGHLWFVSRGSNVNSATTTFYRITIMYAT
jgi:hypothetical protein